MFTVNTRLEAMEQLFGTTEILYGILGLIILICFFFLLYYAYSINKKLHKNEDFFHQKFVFLISIGEKEPAKKLLIDRIEADTFFFPLGFLNKEEEYSRNSLHKKYGKYMDIVGISIDEEKVIKTLDHLNSTK